MTDTAATYSRSVTVDLPDWASGTVTFNLLSFFAAAGTEGFPQKSYTLTLDGSGTGTQILPVPDNTGAASWLWEIVTPDDVKYTATLAYDASAIQLTAWLAAALSSDTPNSLTDTFVLKDGDTMTGLLTLSGAPTDDLHASTKKYVDDNGGAAAIDDLSDVTITSVADSEVLAYDNGSSMWINETLSEAGIADTSHAHEMSDLGGLGFSADDYVHWDGDEWTLITPANVLADIGALPEDAGILSKSTTYEVAAGDEGKIIECDGTFTVTFPDSLDAGFQVTIVNVGSGTITLAAATTLVGEGTLLETQYTGAVVYHRGSDVWLAMGKLTSA